MICIIAHEVPLPGGFKVFEAGKEYGPEEVGDRGKYFKDNPATEAEQIKEEVKDHDADA